MCDFSLTNDRNEEKEPQQNARKERKPGEYGILAEMLRLNKSLFTVPSAAATGGT